MQHDKLTRDRTAPTSPAHHDRIGEYLMSLVWRKPPADVAERTRRRITVHLLPYLFFLYVLAYLDRFNVSVAQLGMKLPPSEQGLGFTDDIIAHGAGLFFWGYWILEMPSTMSVAKWGARWVFVRILIMWGIFAALCGFIGLPAMKYMLGWLPEMETDGLGVFGAVRTFINDLPTNAAYQFYVFRFLLGFFEGGFFPTVIVYLTYWFRPKDRAKAVACFMVAIPFSGAVGIPLSGLLLNVNWLGLAGWRWVYIVEGIMPVFAGIATIFFLPNRPQDAKWLPEDERKLLVDDLEEELNKKKGHGHFAWVHNLGMVLLLTLVYFGLNVSSYGLSMFMPAIIKSQTGASNLVATLISGVYYTIAACAMLLNGWHSDRTNERIFHVCIPLALQGTAIFLVALLADVPVLPVIIIVLMLGATHYTHLPAFWPIPTMFLGAIAAASAIGFINMIGNLGGYFGPRMVGTAATEDINWLKGTFIQDNREGIAAPAAEAERWRAEIAAAKSPSEISRVVADVNLPAELQRSQRATGRISQLRTSMEAGGKLTAEQTLEINRYLALVEKRVPLTEDEQSKLVSLLGQGVNFSSGLLKLAPWPIMSAVVILIVGFLRRRHPLKT